ncbi:VanZ family protein [Micrococcaceae bacterium Sec5.7]
MALSNLRAWRWFLGLYFGLLALVGFWPTPVDTPAQGALADVLSFLHVRGIPLWFNYGFVEAAANVMLFVPVGFTAAMAFPKIRSWKIAALSLFTSACVELGQLLFLHDRVASPLDIVTNTAGAVIGIFFARARR